MRTTSHKISAWKQGQKLFAGMVMAVATVACGGLLIGTTSSCIADDDDDDTLALNAEERLGKLLFFDTNLSTPQGMACANCHAPEVGFADPEKHLPVSRGAIPGRFGNRNDQPAAYASFAPPLHKDPEEDIWVGGLFWDGRANTLAEQAQGPPLNPVEMANPDTVSVVKALREAEYAELFYEVYGAASLDDPGRAYVLMSEALEAYERSPELNRFDSKYDYWLRGEAELTEQELRGLELFEAEDKGNCAACHPNQPAEDGTPPLFTDYTYDNLGVPRNPENPHYFLPPELNPDGIEWVDVGLATTVNDPAERGKFRVPTLRNVAITEPYMHNGVFKTLFQVMAFYNSRDVIDWSPPEVAENVNTEELGNLGLSTQEMEDVVVFMGTLTDGYTQAAN